MQMQDTAFRPISNEIEKTHNTRKWKLSHERKHFLLCKKKVLRLYPEKQATPTMHVRTYASLKTFKIWPLQIPSILHIA